MGNTPRILRELLNSKISDEVIKRAALFAARRLELYEWQGSKKGMPPSGRTAEDFVHDTIVKLYTGQRTWDPKKHPDFFIALCGMIRSEISNCRKSNENKKTYCESALPSSKWTKAPLDDFAHLTNSTDRPILELEKEIEDDNLLLAFVNHIEDDDELMGVMEGMMDGFVKPGEIATLLGISTDKMENIQKRWKRQIDKFRKANGIGQKTSERSRTNG